MKSTRKLQTRRRHARIRRKVKGSTERPRLAVFRSNTHIYAQVIDDLTHHTLLSASTLDAEFKASGQDNTATMEAAAQVGKLLAEKALKQGIQQVVFDRGGNLYHGRVAALAEAAREAGLEF
ncbi:MAG: 50S ribosomal protein L18 [Cyanobacteria bacterium P01_A01_bin.123]